MKANIETRETQAVNQAMLASNCFSTGVSSLEYYSAADNTPEVLDLVLSNLPADSQAHTIKKISGSRHVVSATVDEDNFKGICKGTGRI